MNEYRRLAAHGDRYRWGQEGPPMEAYSRYTDPERFEPLHAFAWAVIRQLEAVFHVRHVEVQDPELDAEVHGTVRHAVRLAPPDPSCAAVTIGFTSFPGLAIHCGHRLLERFPSCGCDACGETADSEAVRFEDVVVAVTQGSFSEYVLYPFIGFASYGWDLHHDGGRSGSRTMRVPRPAARRMIRAHGRRTLWKPWPRRQELSPRGGVA
jgi:hypothetical protein